MDEIKYLIRLKIKYYRAQYERLSNSTYLRYALELEELHQEIKNIPESIMEYEFMLEEEKWLIGQMV